MLFFRLRQLEILALLILHFHYFFIILKSAGEPPANYRLATLSEREDELQVIVSQKELRELLTPYETLAAGRELPPKVIVPNLQRLVLVGGEDIHTILRGH